MTESQALVMKTAPFATVNAVLCAVAAVLVRVIPPPRNCSVLRVGGSGAPKLQDRTCTKWLLEITRRCDGRVNNASQKGRAKG